MNSFTKGFDGSTPSSGGAYWDGLPDYPLWNLCEAEDLYFAA